MPLTKPAVPRRADWFLKKFAGGGSEGSGSGISGGGGRGVVFRFFGGFFAGLGRLAGREEWRDDDDGGGGGGSGSGGG